MDTIDLIVRSRKVLKEILSKEWNVEDINELSPEEIRERYISKNKSSKITFGSASNCNITLNHRKIPEHQLHIIYYNFSEIGQPPIKVTKICCEKIISLYEDTINNNDSLLVIMQMNNISDSLLKSFELISKDISNTIQLEDNIKEQNDKLKINEKLNPYNFKNIHILSILDLSFNKLNHTLVPKCRIIRNQKEKDEIIKKTNSTKNQLPVQLWSDKTSQLLLSSPDDIIEYTRKTHTAGDNIYYRLCCYN